MSSHSSKASSPQPPQPQAAPDGEAMPGDSAISNQPPQLSGEDLDRVARYLSSPVHQVERKPFRPWLMMAGLLGVVTALSLVSLLISSLVL